MVLICRAQKKLPHEVPPLPHSRHLHIDSAVEFGGPPSCGSPAF